MIFFIIFLYIIEKIFLLKEMAKAKSKTSIASERNTQTKVASKKIDEKVKAVSSNDAGWVTNPAE